jgi:hypothetical protein
LARLERVGHLNLGAFRRHVGAFCERLTQPS